MKDESRPKPTLVNSAGGRVSTSESTVGPQPGHRDAADVFEDCYAVVVYGRATRRHIFLTLGAAERAVDRAHARGDDASMALVRLIPVDPEPAERIVRRSVDVDEMLRDLESSGVTP